MPVLAYLVMDETEKNQAVLLNGDGVGVAPRIIDNPQSNQLGYGTLVGMFVVPARLMTDPDYARWVDMFSDNDIHIFDTDTLFLPMVEEE